MRLLLDTHVLLWSLADDPRLATSVRDLIIDSEVEVFVSAASAWEITIKQGLGKLRAPDDLAAQLVAARFEALPITVDHAVAVLDLPDHHRDPFDRMLIAQARVEGLTVVTHDPQIGRYEVAVLET